MPNRAVVMKALADVGGHKAKAAALLGCSRETLYMWCSLLGLDKYAGIRRHTLDELDRKKRPDAKGNEESSISVRSAKRETPTLALVEARAAVIDEIPIPASLKLPPSLWRRVKVEAARRDMRISELVSQLLEAGLRTVERAHEKKGEKA